MISEITILKLQTATALLMGYDYFVSDALKEKANAIASDVFKTYQALLDQKLKNQLDVFLTWIPTIVSGIIYSIIGIAIYVFANDAIAALGMLFLIASFLCRYADAGLL